jgi:hypothetical protein
MCGVGLGWVVYGVMMRRGMEIEYRIYRGRRITSAAANSSFRIAAVAVTRDRAYRSVCCLSKAAYVRPCMSVYLRARSNSGIRGPGTVNDTLLQELHEYKNRLKLRMTRFSLSISSHRPYHSCYCYTLQSVRNSIQKRPYPPPPPSSPVSTPSPPLPP